jgi:predicted amidohydrolase
VAQIESTREPEENLAKAARTLRQARQAGASVLVFPEYFMSWGPGSHDREAMTAVARPVDGPFVERLRQMAGDAGMWIVGGVIESGSGTDGRPFNTIVVADQHGGLRATYRKTHMFDAFSYRESAAFFPGDRPFTPLTTPLGSTGLLICYELRFPEITRRQALLGATVLLAPTAWVAGPMKDMHWLTLLRARAIENGCYVVGAAQAGNEFAGQSAIIDPMGSILAQAGAEETVITAAIDTRQVERAREIIPSLANRRPELYAPETA